MSTANPLTGLDPVNQALAACLRSPLPARLSTPPEPPAPPQLLAALSLSQQEELLRRAAAHHILPILNSRLAAHGLRAALPPAFASRLQREVLEAEAINLGRLVQLETLLKAFTSAGIDLILLKGLHLTLLIYPQPTQRVMGDFDLLLRPSDLPAAQRLMETLGYRPHRSYTLDFAMQMNKHMPPYVRQNWPTVELHWTLADPQDPIPLDMPAIWQRSQPLSFAGTSARVLSLPDLLTHLSLHAVIDHHLHMGLRPLVDVQAVLEKIAGDPAIFNSQSLFQQTQPALARATSLMLRLAHELLAAPLPTEAVNLPGFPQMENNLYLAACRKLFDEHQPRPLVSPDLAALASDASFLKKLRILSSRLFLDRRTMATLYPVSPDSPRLYLYYPLRLAYLFRTYGHILWGRLRYTPHVMSQIEQQAARNDEEEQLAHWLHS